MQAVDQVAAIEELRRLKARYFRCVDTKDCNGLATVFAPDIIFDRRYDSTVQVPFTGEWTPPLSPKQLVVRGADAVLVMVRRAVGEISTVHHGHTYEIDFIDDDTATAIRAMSDELRDRHGRLILAGQGHYHHHLAS